MKTEELRAANWKYDTFLSAWILYAGYYACRRDIGMPSDGSFSRVALELACFGTTYAIGQFFGGAYADDTSASWTAVCGAIISVVCTLLQGWVSPATALLLQLGNGLGQGLGWPSLLKLMGHRFDSGERDRVLGWWSTSYILGGFLATVLVQWLSARSDDLGIDPLHILHIVPPALLLLAAVFFTYKAPRSPAGDQALDSAPASGLERWKRILRVREMRYAAGMYFFLKMTRYTLLFWLPHYLISSVGYSIYSATRTASYFEICGMLGPIAAGYATAYSFGANRMRLGAAMVYALAFMCLVHPLLAAAGFWGMILSISLLGILIHGADMLVSGMAVLDAMPQEQHGRAVGFVNGVGSLGQALSPLLATLFVAHFGWNKLFDLFVLFALISGAICTLGSRLAPPKSDALIMQGFSFLSMRYTFQRWK